MIETNDLIKKINNIKNQGWIKSIQHGNGGVGLTFENLLGIERNQFEFPDYEGIEIKTKRSYSKSFISLFSYSPEGETFNEANRIKELYGYPHSKAKQFNVLANSIYATTKTRIGINYYFKLEVDRDKEKIYLLVFDKKHNFIEKKSFWNFNIIKEKLIRKLSYLCYVKAHTKIINGEEYFKYYKFNIYKLKNFETFINLLEHGIVRITFKLSVFLNENKYGKIHNHGTDFNISEENLNKLYDKYII